jgi:hypothetical protein
VFTERSGVVAGPGARRRTRGSMQALGQLTRMVDGRPRIVADPPLLVPARCPDAGSGAGRLWPAGLPGCGSRAAALAD